jgi:hypothetical protein
VAVAVADTDEDVETEYDADPLVEIDAEGVLVCFGEMLADDEGDVDTVGILEDVTLTEAVAEILIDPVPNGLTVPELDNDPEIDDDCVCEEVGEPDDDGVCVWVTEPLAVELCDGDTLVEPEELPDGELLPEPLDDPDGDTLTDDVTVTLAEEDCVWLFVGVEEIVWLADDELLTDPVTEDELVGESEEDTLLVVVGVREEESVADADPLEEIELDWVTVIDCVTDDEDDTVEDTEAVKDAWLLFVVEDDELCETDGEVVDESMGDLVAE